jgi:hypothetical protein
MVAVLGTALAAGAYWVRGGRTRATEEYPFSQVRPGATVGLVNKTEGGNTVLAEFPDPNSPGTSKTVFVDRLAFDSGVYQTAVGFTGEVANELSLEELSQSILTRIPQGLSEWRARADRLVLDTPPTTKQATRAVRTWRALAFLEMYEGRFSEARTWLERALKACEAPGVVAQDRQFIRALLGIVALRRGELENCLECVGPSSCILPIEPEAVHQKPDGSREAIRHFSAYLDEWPGDLRIRWLLNLAYMTLGEYPDKVPSAFRIPLDRMASERDVGRFQNVATLVGMTSGGPTQAGGSIFDDFTGDGLPDLFTTSIDADRSAALFVNRGDGSFEDRSHSAGLDGQVYALNVTRADFDNDGNLDVLLLRGGWETPMRLSLLRNTGNGVFEDVTISSGLGMPISSESAAWGDYNNDGLVDIFVCGEFAHPSDAHPSSTGDARNRCRLYRNEGHGKFVDVAVEAGLTNDRYAKGAVWGDYDDDGLLDLFVSNMGDQSRLYHNEGNERFRDVTAEAGLLGDVGDVYPFSSFPCLFWDFDNDGRLDVFMNDWQMTQAEVVAGFLGISPGLTSPPRLYRNLGGGRFRNVSHEVGLTLPIPAMSINCGDIDNDGYLDLYFGTGWMGYAGLSPNVLLRNAAGRQFEDVTWSSRTGHLQKGHGVSFADWDSDGDLDIFAVLGGGCPGDRGYPALFQNPGQRGHWLKVTLIGIKTNRAALGSRIQATLVGPDGAERSIHRMIGTNGSFGGNSLVELFGLGKSTKVKNLRVTWPTSRTTQVFHDLAADQSLVITEGSDVVAIRPQHPLAIPDVGKPKAGPRRSALAAPPAPWESTEKL